MSAQRPPAYAIEVEAGQDYDWCACGRSRTPPFCDGSHPGGACTPLRYTAERRQVLWFCGCRQSQGKPFCDGSHKRPPGPP